MSVKTEDISRIAGPSGPSLTLLKSPLPNLLKSPLPKIFFKSPLWSKREEYSSLKKLRPWASRLSVLEYSDQWLMQWVARGIWLFQNIHNNEKKYWRSEYAKKRERRGINLGHLVVCQELRGRHQAGVVEGNQNGMGKSNFLLGLSLKVHHWAVKLHEQPTPYTPYDLIGIPLWAVPTVLQVYFTYINVFS